MVNHQKKQRQPSSKSLRWFFDLLVFKTICNLKSEVHRNYLSFLWWILEPLLYIAVYYIVFGLLLNRGGENFVVFLLTGLIPWMWFSKSVSAATSSILVMQNIITQVKVPLVIFPLIAVSQSTIKQIPVFVLLIVFVSSQGFLPDTHWLALIPVLLLQFVLIIFTSCAIAAITPFIRDITYIVPTGLTLLMFLSGIFYDYREMAPEWQDIFLLNPVAFLLRCYRDIIMDGALPNMPILFIWGALATVLCGFMIKIYKGLNKSIPRAVLG